MMQEKDYCKKCHLYTSKSIKKEDNSSTEVRYCPVCGTYKTCLKED